MKYFEAMNKKGETLEMTVESNFVKMTVTDLTGKFVDISLDDNQLAYIQELLKNTIDDY